MHTLKVNSVLKQHLRWKLHTVKTTLEHFLRVFCVGGQYAISLEAHTVSFTPALEKITVSADELTRLNWGFEELDFE